MTCCPLSWAHKMLTLTATLLIMPTPCVTFISLPVLTQIQVGFLFFRCFHPHAEFSSLPQFLSCSLCSFLDIPSALADSSVFNPEDSTGGGGFVVHWLNNKDLSFTSSMDLFMTQLRKFSEQHLDQTTDEPLDAEGSPMKFDFGMVHFQFLQ